MVLAHLSQLKKQLDRQFCHTLLILLRTKNFLILYFICHSDYDPTMFFILINFYQYYLVSFLYLLVFKVFFYHQIRCYQSHQYRNHFNPYLFQIVVHQLPHQECQKLRQRYVVDLKNLMLYGCHRKREVRGTVLQILL